MTAVREILVARDFSEASHAAVHVAHRYAEAFDARLYILHVIEPGELGVAEIFARLVTELGTAVPTVVTSHSGDAHGHTGFSRTLLGSVAERVSRTAPCLVLTVPPRLPAARQESLVLPPFLHRCIVCHAMSCDLVCELCRARIRGETIAESSRGSSTA